MNIERLRQVQASIADTSKPFYMGHWCTCIAAHSQSVRTGQPVPPVSTPNTLDPYVEADWLGVDGHVVLFSTNPLPLDNWDRDLAIRRIEELIQTELRHRAIMLRPPVMIELLEDRVLAGRTGTTILDQTPTSWPMPAATVPEDDRELVAV